MSTRMIPRSWSSDTSFLRVKYCKSQLTMSVHHKCSDILKIQFVAEMSHVSLTIGQCVQGGPKTEILKDLELYFFGTRYRIYFVEVGSGGWLKTIGRLPT